ncbi:hypothetical protein CR513_00939, partial [Mucuna pruriens]
MTLITERHFPQLVNSKEEVYMEVPLEFGEKFSTKVCKLKKDLYGLNNHKEPGLRNSPSLLKVKDTLKGKVIIQCFSNMHKIGRSSY